MPRKESANPSPTQPQDQTAKAQAISLLLSSLQDPQKPLHCGICINGAFIECTKDERDYFRPKRLPKRKSTNLQKHDPDVWNTIVKFMFHPRTDEQMESLVEHMADCKCQVDQENGTIERYHEIAVKNLEREDYKYRSTSNENEERHQALKLFTAARCGWVWPISLTDLFPFWADSFVESILHGTIISQTRIYSDSPQVLFGLAKCWLFPVLWAFQLEKISTVITIRRYHDAQRLSVKTSNDVEVVVSSFIAGVGRKCQMNAWRHEDYTHKCICPILKGLVAQGGGSSLFFSGDPKWTSSTRNDPIFEKIVQNWKGAIVDSELELIEDWARSAEESKGYSMPNGTEWTPGYDDYEEVIGRFSENGRGSSPSI